MEEILKEILSELKSMKTDMSDLKSDVSQLKKGQLRLETRIENEVIEKIHALFEDRSMNQDYFTSIKNSLARIEENVEVLYQKSMDQEGKLVEHDQELRLLHIERK